MKEQIKEYVEEDFPKKTYVRRRRIIFRKRKPFEIFFSEILIAGFIIFMLFMVLINYLYTH